jgi:hypothetical protein
MSYGVQVFLRGTTRSEIETLLRDVFGIALREVDTGLGQTLVGQAFGLHVACPDGHQFDNDRGLRFSDYPIYVSFDRSGGRIESAAGDELCVALARALARTARRELGAGYLIVSDMQREIEMTEPAPGEFAARFERT